MSNNAKVTRFGADPLLNFELANKQYVDSQSSSSPLTTKGDLYGFDTVDDRIPIGNNDEVLTADSAQGLGLKWAAASSGGFSTVYKTADETINSDDTLSDDTDLQFPVEANKSYILLLFGMVDGHPTPDYKHAFSLPSGAAGNGGTQNGEFYPANASATYEAGDLTTSRSGTTGGGEINQFLVMGYITVGGTPGTVAYQWAQAVNDANGTTLKEGTYMMYRKVN